MPLKNKRVATEEKPDWGEWLFDLCWLQYDEHPSKGGLLAAVPLIVEIEWGNKGDVEDDFEKLMVGRALVKLLVFDGQGDALKDIPDRLARLLEAFEGGGPDDVYLLAAYTCKGFEWPKLPVRKNQPKDGG